MEVVMLNDTLFHVHGCGEFGYVCMYVCDYIHYFSTLICLHVPVLTTLST